MWLVRGEIMKKILNLFLVCILTIPAFCLAGCNGTDISKNIKNQTFYVTKAQQKNSDVSSLYVDAAMNIVFNEETFKVEFSNQEDTTNYGYYQGTYLIKEDHIFLTVTEAGGSYRDYKLKPDKEASVFSRLRYIDGKLFAEFVFNGAIHSFTLETKEK